MKIAMVVKLFIPLVALFVLVSCNNNPGKNNAGATRVPAASYYLEKPSGWTTEIMPFPIDFAPGINYKGTEDLRFAKGWGDINSDEHWCYAFCWWLDGKPLISEVTLQQNLREYYTGLVTRNIVKNKIPQIRVVPTVATIKKMVTLRGDIATYTGIIKMLDYHSENPIVLNCMIHIKDCNTKDHTALLFLISPKALDQPVWKQLSLLDVNFNCN